MSDVKKSTRGRKLKYGVPSVVLTLRVPENQVEHIKKFVDYILLNDLEDSINNEQTKENGK